MEGGGGEREALLRRQMKVMSPDRFERACGTWAGPTLSYATEPSTRQAGSEVVFRARLPSA